MNDFAMRITSGLAGLLVAAQPALPAQAVAAPDCSTPEPKEVLDLLTQPQSIAPGVEYADFAPAWS